MKNSLAHLLAAAALLLPAAAACAAGYAQNLVVNGGAEDGTNGWTTIDDIPLVDAVAYGPNWVLPTQPGPLDRGLNLFVGGAGKPYAVATQLFDVGSFAGALAGGQVGYTISGWLGGWSDQSDNAKFSALFLDATNDFIGIASIGPLTNVERGNVTGLFSLSASGFVPAATRTIQFVLEAQRNGGGDNDGYADNLSFALTTAVPEPEQAALLLAGLLAIGAFVRRKASSPHAGSKA